MIPKALIDQGRWWEFGWQLVEGCTRCSPGCLHCWSLAKERRLKIPASVRFCEERLDRPQRRGTPAVYSIWNDLFHPGVPFEEIDRVFEVMALCGRRWRYGKQDPEEGTELAPHTFQILTKRPERMAEYFKTARQRWDRWAGEVLPGTVADYVYANGWPLPNVWLGVTIEDNAHLYRADLLQQIPAAVRFVSLEPMLENLELSGVGTNYALRRKLIDWVIVGCESRGGRAGRTCELDWIASAVAQCKAAGVPVFVKQIPIGGDVSKNMAEWPEALRVREWPRGIGNCKL